MSINEINSTTYMQNKNDPIKAYEDIKNDKKNTPEIEKSTSISLKEDTFNSSNTSLSKSNENTYYNTSISSEGSNAITDKYMDDIIKKGKEVPKPSNVEMDDTSWGLLVQIGEKMGLTNADRLSKLTAKDIEAYFYNKNIMEKGKNLLKENLNANEYASYKQKSMSDKEYWDMVFEAKANNQPYTIHTIEKSNTGLKLSANEFFSNKDSINITKFSAGSLHNILMAFENEDVELFVYAIDSAKINNKQKTTLENQKEMIESYNNMQEHAQKILNPYDQLQIIKSSLKNQSFVSYKV